MQIPNGQEVASYTGKGVALYFFASLVVVLGYDLVALFSGGKLQTASHWLTTWSADFPIIPLVAGMVLGHLFLPSK